MINENPLKDYMRKKFKFIYVSRLAAIIIILINIVVLISCCLVMGDYKVGIYDGRFEPLISILIMICAGIIGSFVIWYADKYT